MEAAEINEKDWASTSGSKMNKRLRVKNDTDVMTPAEAAKYLKVSTKVVYSMARAKKLPCMWVGKRARFSKAAIEKRFRRS